jgi:Rrf2 family protein
MRLSNMADYAVVTMSAASRHCGSARVSATDLANETGIALPTTQKLVSILSKAGLLRSARGSGGGISLARPAAAISSCVDTGSHNCAMEGNCRVQPHWPVVNNAVRGALANINLTSLNQ